MGDTTRASDPPPAERGASPRFTVHDLPVPAALVDPADLAVLAANDALCGLLGMSAASLVTRSLAELLPPGASPLLLAAAGRTHEGPQRIDVPVTLGDNDLRGRLTFARVTTDDRLLAVYEDHSAERHELSRLRAAEEAAAREARSRAAALQAELTVVTAYARTLAGAGAAMSASEREDVHERAVEAARRVAELATGQTSPVPGAADVLHDDTSVADVMADVERRVALEVEAAASVLVSDITGEVDVPTAVLRQVLLRLVRDALGRATGGRPHHVHVSMRPVAGGLEVLVTDGAPDDDRELDAVLRSEPAPPLGRALASSRALVEEVGGWLTSVPFTGGVRRALWLPGRECLDG